MITEQLIRRESGEYDCEVVARLKLENFGTFSIYFYRIKEHRGER